MARNGNHTDRNPVAYGFAQTFASLATDWTTFPRHYLLYASSGTFHLDVAQAQWLLPPQRAAWIAADTPVRVSSRAPVTCCSVLFAKESIAAPPQPCQVFTVSPLVREMLLYAMRWGQDHVPADPLADHFLLSLAGICMELAAEPDPCWLPRGRSSDLMQAMEYTIEHVGSPIRLSDVAHVVGVSERTLARRFAEEAAMSWGEFLHRARMITAMERLATGEPTVTETSFATGFDSLSAFSQAFRRFTGESPLHYRRRLQRH